MEPVMPKKLNAPWYLTGKSPLKSKASLRAFLRTATEPQVRGLLATETRWNKRPKFMGLIYTQLLKLVLRRESQELKRLLRG
jgi:hypothetical protein